MRKRTVGAVLGAVFLSVAVTGCSNVTGSAESLISRQPGASASSAAPGGKGAATRPQTEDVAALARQLGTSRTKVADTKTVASSTVIKVDGRAFITLDSQMRFGENGAMRMVMRFDSSFLAELAEESDEVAPEIPPIETLVTPSAMYVNAGEDMAAENGGKPWAKISIDALAKADKSGNGAELKQQLQQGFGSAQDPSAQLALLQRSGDIRQVGKETVDGKSTTHYKGTVSLALLRANSAESMGMSAKEYDKMLDDFTTMGLDESQMDLWVGDDGLLVKQDVRMRVEAEGATETIRMTTTYTGWGAPINDTPPPASQTKDISQDIIDGTGMFADEYDDEDTGIL